MRQTKVPCRHLRSCDVCCDLFFIANLSLRFKSRKKSTSKGNHNYQLFKSYCWFSLLSTQRKGHERLIECWQTNRRKRNTIAAVCFRKLVESSGHETKEIWIISKQNRKSRERDISQRKAQSIFVACTNFRPRNVVSLTFRLGKKSH